MSHARDAIETARAHAGQGVTLDAAPKQCTGPRSTVERGPGRAVR